MTTMDRVMYILVWHRFSHTQKGRNSLHQRQPITQHSTWGNMGLWGCVSLRPWRRHHSPWCESWPMSSCTLPAFGTLPITTPHFWNLWPDGQGHCFYQETSGLWLLTETLWRQHGFCIARPTESMLGEQIKDVPSGSLGRAGSVAHLCLATLMILTLTTGSSERPGATLQEKGWWREHI